MVIAEKINNRNLKKCIESIIFYHCDNLKDTVLIKPNWGGRLPLIKGENTDSYFLKVLTEVLYNRKVSKIFIAHYPLLKIENEDYSFETLLKITGVNKLKFPSNVEFLNLDNNIEKECVDIEGFRFHLPKILKDAFYINLAKLKTHMETRVSLCLKNQMGLLPSEDKILMHKKGLEQGIALLATKLKPDLSIIDGIVSMDKNGPHHGRTRITDILIYSDNLVEADSLASYIMGYIPQDISHIKIASILGVGKIISKDLLDKYKKYKLPKFILSKEYLKRYNLTIWPTTACSRCIFNLDKTQKYIKKDFFLLYKLFLNKHKAYNIVIGRGETIKGKFLPEMILIGECTKDLASEKKTKYLQGCPPATEKIFNFIKESIIR